MAATSTTGLKTLLDGLRVPRGSRAGQALRPIWSTWACNCCAAVGHELAVSAGAPRSLGRLFFDGALSNVSNPKIAVFYFAFLPQFVLPGAAHADTVGVRARPAVRRADLRGRRRRSAWVPALLSAWLRARPQVLTWVYRGSGAVLVGLGLTLGVRAAGLEGARSVRAERVRRAGRSDTAAAATACRAAASACSRAGCGWHPASGAAGRPSRWPRRPGR